MSEIKNAMKIAEASKKVESARKKLENELKHLESDVLHERDTSSSAIDVKYAKKALERAENELDRLKR